MTLSSELTFTKDISLSRRAKPSSASKTVATKVKLVAKKVKFVATKIKSIATKVKFVAMLRFFLAYESSFRPHYADYSHMRPQPQVRLHMRPPKLYGFFANAWKIYR